MTVPKEIDLMINGMHNIPGKIKYYEHDDIGQPVRGRWVNARCRYIHS